MTRFVPIVSPHLFRGQDARPLAREIPDDFPSRLHLFSQNFASAKGAATVIALIEHEAGECLKAADGINFENKIVLAIAIRLASERFMIAKINDPAFVAGIDSNQTPRLLKKFRELFSAKVATINVLHRVVLMTPENIHLNSFMYEPILDMSDGHLRKLYGEVKALV